MSRISKVPVEEWDPRLRAAIRPEQASELEQGLSRFFAHSPDIALGLMGFAGSLKVHRTLPERLVELVRLRIAFFNQCRSCMAIRYTDAVNDGLTEDLVCSLERPEDAADLTEAEKAAIAYGGAIFVGFGRLAATYHMVEELPETFRAEQEEISPWGNESIQVR
jgi:AhpD family alkylhydroperoxidase